MMTTTNDSGTFWVDDEGVLRKYECAEDNFFQRLDDPNYRNKKELFFLKIPEEVIGLPAGAFDGYVIHVGISLPETLTTLGDASGGVFRHCSIRCSLELPKGITYVGNDSFFMSALSTIRISDDMDALTAQALVQLFRNHTYHHSLFYPVEKIRDLPPLQVPTTQICNESGAFYVDRLGVLQAFCCSSANNADVCSERDTKKLYTLHIPEGVTVLKAFAFREYTVLEKLTLPDSLLLMGTGDGCVFTGCSLPDVVIPETVQILGNLAFQGSSLRSLRLPENAQQWENARQFTACEIGILYLSEKYREESDDPELRRHIGLGYISCNIGRIGEIWWD